MFKQTCGFLVLFIFAVVSNQAEAQTKLDDLKGAWLGVMQIPDGPKLRVGVEVFKKAGGQWGGNVASLDQASRYMLVSDVSVDNEVFKLKMANAPISIVGKVDKSKTRIMAQFNQGKHGFALELSKVDELPETVRKQTPTETSGYNQREARYKNATDNVWLSGTLTYPKDSKRRPAVMLIAGSGPNHRDSYHGGHRTFKVLADHLSKNGYVVLRSDKRGVYKSSGDYSSAGLDELAKDSQAAIRFLKSLEQVDPQQINLIGHSEGSFVAAMAAQLEPVKGIVSMAGPGMSIVDVLLAQDQSEPAAKGATKAETDILLGFSQRFYDIVLNTTKPEKRKAKIQALYDNLADKEAQTVEKWVNRRNGTLSIEGSDSASFRHFLQQDPLAYWQQFKGHALVLNGRLDSQVPADDNVAGIVKAMSAQPNRVESHVFETLNHMFQSAKTGAISEYSVIEQTIDVQVLEVITDWLRKNEISTKVH